METKNLEKYEEQQERNGNYSKLLMEFHTFKDISTMCPNLIIFRNKIGTTDPPSLLISHDIVSSGISAMKQKYIEELKKLKLWNKQIGSRLLRTKIRKTVKAFI